jgi:hypothetical protein
MSPAPLANKLGVAALLVGMAAALGCSSSRMTTVWKDAEYTAGPLRKLVVVSARKDAVQQRIWEDTIVGELGRHGVVGVPSYSLVTNGVVDSTRVRLAEQSGADGLLLVRSAGQEINTYEVPGNIVRTPVGTVVDPFWGTITTVYDEIATPGSVETEEVRRFGSRLLVAENGKGRLVWGARVETVDAGSTTEAAQQTAKLLISDLAKRGLIAH